MSTVSTPAAIRTRSFPEIAELLERDADTIADEWMRRTRQERPETCRTHHQELRDSIPAFLRAAALSLRTSGEGSQTAHRLLACEHGEQRWEIGWELAHVIHDYRLLRITLLDYLRDQLNRSLTSVEVLALGMYIDEAIQSAVVTYVEHQEVQLREAHQRFSEFMGVLGHELRNPLNSISMTLQLLGRADLPERNEVTQMARHQMTLLTRLIDDMLDISRITRGRLEVRRTRTDLRDIVDRACQSTRMDLQAKGHTFERSLPPDPVWVEADPTRLAQVFANLLGNAVKYTDPGGKISLTLTVEAGQATIRVRDTGEGIDPELLPRIFDLFVQDRRNEHRGLGIGLALARAFVERHHGQIDARSDGPGTGSEFVVTLPLAEPALSPELAAPSAKSSAPPNARLGILIADDQQEGAQLLATFFRENGHEVWVAFDGEEALRLARAHRPRILILDVAMPKRDGLDVVRELRAEPAFQEALMLAMTGFAQNEARDETRLAGFDDHIAKPIDIEALRARIAAGRSAAST